MAEGVYIDVIKYKNESIASEKMRKSFLFWLSGGVTLDRHWVTLDRHWDTLASCP